MTVGLSPDYAYNARVRALRADGAISAWSSWSSIESARDEDAPDAVTGFTVTPGIGSILFRWTGPTLDDTPDLRGFYIYYSDTATGDLPGLVAMVGVTNSYIFELPAKTSAYDAYYNIRAYDVWGNFGPMLGTWQYCLPASPAGLQLLTNADLEVDLDASGDADDWSWDTPLPSEITYWYQAPYGRYGGKGYLVRGFSVPVCDVDAIFTWPDNYGTRKELVLLNDVFCLSIWFKSWYSPIEGWESGVNQKWELELVPIFHDGTSLKTDVGYEVMDDQSLGKDPLQWNRHYTTIQITSLPSGTRYIGYRFIATYKGGYFGYDQFSFDQPQLERGSIPTEWGMRAYKMDTTGATAEGLRLDTSAILKPDGGVLFDKTGVNRSKITTDHPSEAAHTFALSGVDKATLGVNDKGYFQVCLAGSLSTYGYTFLSDRLDLVAPAAGDAYITLGIGVSSNYSFGIDYSDSEAFKLTPTGALHHDAHLRYDGSQLEIKVASGDPIITFDIGATDKFTVGVDDDDSDRFKICPGSSLGEAGFHLSSTTGRPVISTASGTDSAIFFTENSVTVGTIGIDSDDSILKIQPGAGLISGTDYIGFPANGEMELRKASGDPQIVFDINGTDKFTLGVDDSDSDDFKISVGGSLGTYGNIMRYNGMWELSVESSDPIIVFDIGGTDKWTIGVDDSDGDDFKICAAGSLSAAEGIFFLADGQIELSSSITTDPIVVFSDAGVAKWTLGFDNDDSDIFKIHTGSALATDPIFALDSNGTLFLNENADANTTIGIVINQLTNDDYIMQFKSYDDVQHPFTDLCEQYTYATFGKVEAAYGGLHIRGYLDSGATYDQGITITSLTGDEPDTGKTTGDTGSITLHAGVSNGAGDQQALGANANAVCFRTVGSTFFIVDEDGDVYYLGSLVPYDEHNDAELLRALAIAGDEGRGNIVRSEFDQFLRYNEQDLVDLGILGAPRSEGGLVCLTKLTELLIGSAWQSACELREIRAEVAEVRERLAKLLAPA